MHASKTSVSIFQGYGLVALGRNRVVAGDVGVFLDGLTKALFQV